MIDNTAVIIAALLGRTNMGHGFPDPAYVSWPEDSKYALTLNDTVEAVCGSFMENDEHYNIFMEESQGWLSQIETEGIIHFAKTFPDHFIFLAGVQGEDLSELEGVE